MYKHSDLLPIYLLTYLLIEISLQCLSKTYFRPSNGLVIVKLWNRKLYTIRVIDITANKSNVEHDTNAITFVSVCRYRVASSERLAIGDGHKKTRYCDIIESEDDRLFNYRGRSTITMAYCPCRSNSSHGARINRSSYP